MQRTNLPVRIVCSGGAANLNAVERDDEPIGRLRAVDLHVQKEAFDALGSVGDGIADEQRYRFGRAVVFEDTGQLFRAVVVGKAVAPGIAAPSLHDERLVQRGEKRFVARDRQNLLERMGVALKRRGGGFLIGFPVAGIEVEQRHAVRALRPPVGKDGVEHLSRRIGVGVGLMVRVEAGIELDGAAGCAAYAVDVDLKGAGAYDEAVDEPLLRPGGDVEPVLTAAVGALGHAGGEQNRMSPLLLIAERQRTQVAQKLRDVRAQFPLPPRFEKGRVAAEVDAIAVEVIAVENFAKNAQLVIAHLGNGEIGHLSPVVYVVFGMLVLETIPSADVRAADAVGEQALYAAPAAAGDVLVVYVDAAFPQLGECALIFLGQNAAVTERDLIGKESVPVDAVDLPDAMVDVIPQAQAVSVEQAEPLGRLQAAAFGRDGSHVIEKNGMPRAAGGADVLGRKAERHGDSPFGTAV